MQTLIPPTLRPRGNNNQRHEIYANFRKGKIRFFFEVKKRFVIEIVYNEVGRWLLDGG